MLAICRNSARRGCRWDGLARVLTDGAAGPVDGLDGVGYGSCTPGVLTLEQEVVFGVMYGESENFRMFTLPDPPIAFSHFGRTVRTGEVVESDIVICIESVSPGPLHHPSHAAGE